MFFFKKKNTATNQSQLCRKKKGSFCHEQYNIYTWIVKKEKITMHICMSIYMHKRMGTICFLSKSQNIFSLPLAQKWFFAKKKGTQQLRLKVSSALKSTIFTCEWLKEKGNNAYTYVSIHVYTYTQMNEHYFITKLFFFPSLLAQKVILAKKMGTTATVGGVSYYVQCNIPT